MEKAWLSCAANNDDDVISILYCTSEVPWDDMAQQGDNVTVKSYHQSNKEKEVKIMVLEAYYQQNPFTSISDISERDGMKDKKRETFLEIIGDHRVDNRP